MDHGCKEIQHACVFRYAVAYLFLTFNHFQYLQLVKSEIHLNITVISASSYSTATGNNKKGSSSLHTNQQLIPAIKMTSFYVSRIIIIISSYSMNDIYSKPGAHARVTKNSIMWVNHWAHTTKIVDESNDDGDEAKKKQMKKMPKTKICMNRTATINRSTTTALAAVLEKEKKDKHTNKPQQNRGRIFPFYMALFTIKSLKILYIYLCTYKQTIRISTLYFCWFLPACMACAVYAWILVSNTKFTWSARMKLLLWNI